MPSSRPVTVPVVIRLLRQLKPHSILDIGIGFGKWGHLFREYTDINEAERDPARYQRANWRIRIDGIEGHAPYITEMHRYLYNEIHLGDASVILPTLPVYDLVFLGDIIEHLDKPAGIRLLETALERAGKAVIVSTPKFETEQEDLCGNELERHRSLWSARDFKRWPRAQVRTVGGDTLIAVLPAPGQKSLQFAAEKRSTSAAIRQMQLARSELTRLLPLDEPFVLIDEEQLRSTLAHREAHPFPGKDGVYWGPPADDESAIAELEALRANGIKKVVLIWSAYWWLEHYPGLRRHLETEWTLAHAIPSLMLYQAV